MDRTVPIPEGHRHNLETIKAAAQNEDLALLAAFDQVTGQPVTLLVAITDTPEEYNLVPLAQMFGDFNPYERFTPPVLEDNRPI
jgi:hypothetical protein